MKIFHIKIGKRGMKMVSKNYPIILGGSNKSNKIAIGIKANQGVGYDVSILGLKNQNSYRSDCSTKELLDFLDGREYITLRFCTMDSLDSFIHLLQDTKRLWEKEQNGEKNKLSE